MVYSDGQVNFASGLRTLTKAFTTISADGRLSRFTLSATSRINGRVAVADAGHEIVPRYEPQKRRRRHEAISLYVEELIASASHLPPASH